MDATLKGNVAVEQLRCFERLQNAVEWLILLPLTPSLSASGTKVECRFLQECWHKQAEHINQIFNLFAHSDDIAEGRVNEFTPYTLEGCKFTGVVCKSNRAFQFNT
ncbi:hypothetical protein CDAR_24421 [Caerostris darwini]|uniref:Uncharacterized protein n=1 Tax=Caerostris darwini TaxID=1538125 RepID=A0AAV4QIV6_9ARAC|nr:hypothetical protein CDAR_24421 [Caerostris darwini]